MTDPIAPAIRADIEGRLDTIESEEGIRYVLAIESGSRAWGFASPDSDYDVRFVYVHPRDDYLARFDADKDQRADNGKGGDGLTDEIDRFQGHALASGPVPSIAFGVVGPSGLKNGAAAYTVSKPPGVVRSNAGQATIFSCELAATNSSCSRYTAVSAKNDCLMHKSGELDFLARRRRVVFNEAYLHAFQRAGAIDEDAEHV